MENTMIIRKIRPTKKIVTPIRKKYSASTRPDVVDARGGKSGKLSQGKKNIMLYRRYFELLIHFFVRARRADTHRRDGATLSFPAKHGDDESAQHQHGHCRAPAK